MLMRPCLECPSLAVILGLNHRIESLGLILFLSEFLTRKLNFEELHKQQILKINEIVQSQVK